MVTELLPAAFAIAMLGAIESLLCAVVLDGMTGKRHSANSELLGQGVGNILTPFFGGITATAAIARSAANYRAGAQSPVAAMVHAVVVLLALVSLASVLAYLPMPAMAALLVMVAWNMSEAPKSLHMLRTAPRSDILVFLTCFWLTVMLDMVIAITTGVLLAAVLFMREMAQMTKVTDITAGTRVQQAGIAGRLAGLQDQRPAVLRCSRSDLRRAGGDCPARPKGCVLYMDGVTILDAGGLSALTKLIAACRSETVPEVVIADLQFQPLRTLARAGVEPEAGVSRVLSNPGGRVGGSWALS